MLNILKLSHALFIRILSVGPLSYYSGITHFVIQWLRSNKMMSNFIYAINIDTYIMYWDDYFGHYATAKRSISNSIENTIIRYRGLKLAYCTFSLSSWRCWDLKSWIFINFRNHQKSYKLWLNQLVSSETLNVALTITAS